MPNDDIISCDIDSDIVTFLNNNIRLISINLNNVNLDNFGDCDPKTIIKEYIYTYIYIKKNRDKELLSVQWNQTGAWECCMFAC